MTWPFSFKRASCNVAALTGVQIHSWGKEQNDGTPNLEYVQPVSAYTVVNGTRTALNLGDIPALTPRQQRELLAARGGNGNFGPEEVGPSLLSFLMCFFFVITDDYRDTNLADGFAKYLWLGFESSGVLNSNFQSKGCTAQENVSESIQRLNVKRPSLTFLYILDASHGAASSWQCYIWSTSLEMSSWRLQ